MDVRNNHEELLWRRCLDGDAEAFGLIFDHHRDRVFRHLYRMLQNQADAEDAVAASFLELWRRRGRVRLVDGSVLAWLLATATNVSRNLRRSQARYRRLLSSLPREAHRPSAEEVAIADLPLRSDLASALNELSTKDVQLFSLVALEGYSPAMAAESMGISAGAARTRLHRIRTKLQGKLGHKTLSSYLIQEAKP
jgi:RNA polymerase sigma factor (sigma-70 family)